MSSIFLSFGEWDSCMCGRVHLYPYEQAPWRITADCSPVTDEEVEDLSITWDEAPPPESNETITAWFKNVAQPRTFDCYRGAAPWDGICIECGEEIHQGSDFVRLTFDEGAHTAYWVHGACAEKCVKYATLKQKKYRVHRVKCKLCGDVVSYGEGTGKSEFSLFGKEGTCCRCGKVSLYPFAREQYRIQVYQASMDDVEDMSVEWDGEDTFPTVYNDVAKWPGVCAHCLKEILEGSDYVRFRKSQDMIYWLHPNCAEDGIVKEE